MGNKLTAILGIEERERKIERETETEKEEPHTGPRDEKIVAVPSLCLKWSLYFYYMLNKIIKNYKVLSL